MPKMMPGTMVAATLAGGLMLGACAERIAESRVQTALVSGGLSARDADCMAGRMVDRLTIPQLRRLEALSGQSRETIGTLSLTQYIDLVRRIGDAEVIAVTTTSAALCATGLAS